MNSKAKINNFKMILKYISTIISWTIFVLLSIVGILLLYYFVSSRLYVTKGDQYEPAFSIYTIVSGSMEPTIKVYDVIINTKIDADDVKVNDVITFTSTSSNTAGMTITHRVIGVKTLDDGTSCFVTRGDNNTNEDNSCVAEKNIIGKVNAVIPQLGRIQFFLASKFGWVFVILIPALYILLKDMYKLLKKSMENKKSYPVDKTIQIPIVTPEHKVFDYEEYVKEDEDIKSENVEEVDLEDIEIKLKKDYETDDKEDEAIIKEEKDSEIKSQKPVNYNKSKKNKNHNNSKKKKSNANKKKK